MNCKERGHAGLRVLYAVPVVLALWVVMAKYQPLQGKLGHDYLHYIPRLLMGSVHFWQNGWTVPHFTAALCGGIPFFADPQSMYYSLPQFLSFWIDPLLATRATFLLFYVLGFCGMWQLCRQIFRFGIEASILAALAFVLNGFAFAHLYVGHITHHPYLLFPGMLWLLYRSADLHGRAWWSACAAMALVGAYFVLSGAMHVAVVFTLCFVVFLPSLYRYHADRHGLVKWLRFLGFSTLALAAVASGRFAVVLPYSEHFIEMGIDRSDLSLVRLVLQYFYFIPSKTAQYLPFGGLRFGSWEFVGFVTKLSIPAVVFLIYKTLTSQNPKVRKLGLQTAYASFFVAVLAYGSPFNEVLPVLKRYHNPIKILGALVPLLVLALAWGLHQLFESLRNLPTAARAVPVVYAGIAIFLLGEFAVLSRFIQDNPSALGYPYSAEVYQTLKRQQRSASVEKIVNVAHGDEGGLFVGASSLGCYEPLFGYRREALRAQLKLAPTREIAQGHFNLTHPACFLYPKELGCRAWDRIPASQTGEFEAFVSGKHVAAWVPTWHRVLLAINFIVTLLLLALVVSSVREKIRFPKSRS